MTSGFEKSASRNRDRFCRSNPLTSRLMKRLDLSGAAIHLDPVEPLALVEELDRFICANQSDFVSSTALVDALIEAALLFDAVGATHAALATSLKAVDHANRTRLAVLQRRAHDMAGLAYCRLCKVGESAAHLLTALRLARQAGDGTGELATLVNISELLECTGVTRAALELCNRIAALPGPGGAGDHLQFRNAVNGLKLALALGDAPEASRLFHACRALKNARSCIAKTPSWRARSRRIASRTSSRSPDSTKPPAMSLRWRAGGGPRATSGCARSCWSREPAWKSPVRPTAAGAAAGTNSDTFRTGHAIARRITRTCFVR